MFKEVHPEHREKLWRQYRALYVGGADLLENKEVMKAIFPTHHDEEKDIYDERKRRAFYIPIAGEILDSIAAKVMTEPLIIKGVTGKKETKTEEGKAAKEVEENPDEFYRDFLQDCSPPGGKRCDLNQLLGYQLLEALQTGTAWTCVELPAPDPDAPPTTEQAQANAGLLDAYAFPLAAEDVRNWEEDSAGELESALVRVVTQKWGGIGTSRKMRKETFTYYTREDWRRYSVTYDVTRFPEGPPDETPMVAEGAGGHSFGKVPLARLCLPKGLHAMGRIASIAIEHFNKRNAVSWSQLKNLLPLMYAKISVSDLDPDGAESAGRLLNQRYGPGRLLVIGEKEELAYAAPDSTVYESALADLSGLAESMRAVLRQMSISAEASGGALRRSAESKAVDHGSLATLLCAIGECMREHAIEVMQLVQAGRGDVTETTWEASGMDDFSDVTTDQVVEQAMMLEQVTIPSSTFQRRKAFMVARTVLGQEASAEDLENIKKELETNITDDQFIAPTPMEQFELEQQAAAAKTAPEGPPK